MLIRISGTQKLAKVVYILHYFQCVQILMNVVGEFQTPNCLDDIYYHRECVCYSLEGRLVDLITISSYHNMSSEREIRLKHLFPMVDVPRPFRFLGKKVIYCLGLLLLRNPILQLSLHIH
jgi:hypothetical protein